MAGMATTAAYKAAVSAAVVAILIYAVGVPLFFLGLLLSCRKQLSHRAPPTPLSAVLGFLSAEYRKRYFVWEVEGCNLCIHPAAQCTQSASSAYTWPAAPRVPPGGRERQEAILRLHREALPARHADPAAGGARGRREPARAPAHRSTVPPRHRQLPGGRLGLRLQPAASGRAHRQARRHPGDP